MELSHSTSHHPTPFQPWSPASPLLSLGVNELHDLNQSHRNSCPFNFTAPIQISKISAKRKVALNGLAALVNLPPYTNITATVIHNTLRNKKHWTQHPFCQPQDQQYTNQRTCRHPLQLPTWPYLHYKLRCTYPTNKHLANVPNANESLPPTTLKTHYTHSLTGRRLPYHPTQPTPIHTCSIDSSPNQDIFPKTFSNRQALPSLNTQHAKPDAVEAPDNVYANADPPSKRLQSSYKQNSTTAAHTNGILSLPWTHSNPPLSQHTQSLRIQKQSGGDLNT